MSQEQARVEPQAVVVKGTRDLDRGAEVWSVLQRYIGDRGGRGLSYSGDW